MGQPYSSVFPAPAHDGERHRRKTRGPVTERVADWSVRHRKTAVFGWLLLVAAVFMAGQVIGSRQLPQYDAGQSGQAERVLNQDEPAQLRPYDESVLIQAKTPGATFSTDPAMRQAAGQVASVLSGQPKNAVGIRTPLSPGEQSLVSKDGRSALVTFQVPGNVANVDQAATTDQHAVATVQARYPGLRIAETRDASIQQAINNSLNFGKAETTLVPITLILLLIVFGALVAAGIPLLLAVTALTASLGVLMIVSHVLPVVSSTYEVVVVIGMAVGVDYSLFYLRREREERARGWSFPEALRIASRTSGHTILVSGLTVMTALCGLFVPGGPFLGMAAGAIAIAGSLTVLPALLAWLGPGADAGRIAFLGRRRAAIPLVSIVMNLLSVGAAYGLVTLVFQDGRLQGPLDYTSFGGIIWWVPLFMFVFLFGISMDYHVFILSRIRELWSRGASPREAIVGGIASSAGVVTSAALIMVAVFSVFTTMSLVDLKILGVGLAAAILIDATVVRGILVPAALSLLGDRAWGRRRRLPNREGARQAVPVGAAPSRGA
jgi:uncharacterized membrane protein YdfJ with MMPL/SSD domain